MLAKISGAKSVLLTEQEHLLPLLKKNIAHNFANDDGITACTLNWKEEDIQAWKKEHGTFDIILCCDCIYEPLYGESWKSLAHLMEIIMEEHTVGWLSVERRNYDGVDKFLEYLQKNTKVTGTLHSTPSLHHPHLEMYVLNKDKLNK